MKEIKRKLTNNLLNQLELEPLKYFGADDVGLIFDLHEGGEIIDPDTITDKHNDKIDELLYIESRLLEVEMRVDKIITDRTDSIENIIPKYLISCQEDLEYAEKLALMGIDYDDIIDAMWMRLIRSNVAIFK